MTRFTHCSRIDGTKIRCAPGRAFAAALATSFAMLAIGGAGSVAPIGFAFAQTPGTSGPISLGDLFKPNDSLDLRDGAEEKLRDAAAQTLNPRGGCAEKAKFKVIVKPGDPIYQTAIAQARRDVLKAVLADSPLSSRFEFSYEIASRDDVQVDYDRMPDKEPPKLHTSSVPPKGSKVKPGDPIKVTMVARDDATTWQTGIQRIQLIAQNPGDELVGAQDYPPVIRPNCEGRPEPRTLVLTYTVPSNPPPIVRLRAIAEDFVNLSDFDIAEFPTGDWTGRFESTSVCEGPPGFGIKVRSIGDLALDNDANGNLTGTLAGTTPENVSFAPSCSNTMLAPGTFSAKLVGSYTSGRNTFSAQAVDVRTRGSRNRTVCPYADYVDEKPSFYHVLEAPMFGYAFRDLRRESDGSLKSKGEQTVGYGNGSCTTNYSLTLRQTQN